MISGLRISLAGLRGLPLPQILARPLDLRSKMSTAASPFHLSGTATPSGSRSTPSTPGLDRVVMMEMVAASPLRQSHIFSGQAQPLAPSTAQPTIAVILSYPRYAYPYSNSRPTIDFCYRRTGSSEKFSEDGPNCLGVQIVQLSLAEFLGHQLPTQVETSRRGHSRRLLVEAMEDRVEPNWTRSSGPA
jgi:hypothetical protein